MNSKNTGTSVFILNFISIIAFLVYSLQTTNDLGEKVAFSMLDLIVLFIYFGTLSVLFYGCYFEGIKILNIIFKMVSLMPIVYLLPLTIVHIVFIYSRFDYFSFAITLGGSLWISITMVHLFMKDTHTASVLERKKNNSL